MINWDSVIKGILHGQMNRGIHELERKVFPAPTTNKRTRHVAKPVGIGGIIGGVILWTFLFSMLAIFVYIPCLWFNAPGWLFYIIMIGTALYIAFVGDDHPLSPIIAIIIVLIGANMLINYLKPPVFPIADTSYNILEKCGNDFVVIEKNGKHGLMKLETREIVSEAQWDSIMYYTDDTGYAFSSSNEMYAVLKGDKWGVINLNGKVVSEPQWDYAPRFYSGYKTAIVYKNGVSYTIDRNGNVVK